MNTSPVPETPPSAKVLEALRMLDRSLYYINDRYAGALMAGGRRDIFSLTKHLIETVQSKVEENLPPIIQFLCEVMAQDEGKRGEVQSIQKDMQSSLEEWRKKCEWGESRELYDSDLGLEPRMIINRASAQIEFLFTGSITIPGIGTFTIKGKKT
jgi:hypothetical protein